MFEFHISRFARDQYDFDQSIFQFNGNAILADFAAARRFAAQMNARRDLVHFPEQAVRAGDINAMGLIDEILHTIFAEYRSRINPLVLSQALEEMENRLGRESIDRVLREFTSQFPPVTVYRGELTTTEYLDGAAPGLTHREIALEELLMLWLANANPAFRRHGELFDDHRLQTQTSYDQVVEALEDFLRGAPAFGPDNQPLLEVLRLPARRHPDSLSAQLELLLQSYPKLLSRYQLRLLRGLDLLREENKPVFAGPGPAAVVDFSALAQAEEPERFSPDSEWMPSLVLIAKNAYVWLDQLSRAYGKEIRRLDQVPEEELARLGRYGFSGLWLIGLWERSPASQKIKHLTGNPEAVASAYSLFDYTIAGALGGDDAYARLRERAWRHGLRLAADMVPNHTGIYSHWVLEHPDWFIALDHPPYPAYTFNGPDLSEDPRVGIRIEDHYYSRTDAAVVFERVEHATGRRHYIYHGNDGTSMPWNDTAQLNYLNPEVREAVIQTILSVARKFPVIRFDAAMTLAKKHIQRLWFPEPGQGGAIPSRSEHSLPRARFEGQIPVEFWREVVDRVAAEVPDTLLLAEAFWLMEGYFVRTLGMHRVYNSAFMHMLRSERNAEYRQVIKNTIEFDPEILKRYVNFMNNPDEETAVEQFGKGGKYFGVCTVMATLPGLPMFGHGQVEGFREKYGMEYQRAYYDETADTGLVERHEREIFPLLHRRKIFAGVAQFLLYDLFTDSGQVNEDVFAYSNRLGDQASLVLFHNRWGEAHGTIHTSAAFAVKDGDGRTHLEQRTLASGLGLPDDPASYVIFRDQVSGLEFIRHTADLHRNGWKVDLGAFEYHVFLDFRVVVENEWNHYRLITDYLNGRGVYDLEAVKQEVILQPVLQPWKELVHPGYIRWVLGALAPETPTTDADRQALHAEIFEQAREKTAGLLSAIAVHFRLNGDAAEVETEMLGDLQRLLERSDLLSDDLSDADGAVLLCWLAARRLGRMAAEEPAEVAATSRAWLDEWLFGKVIAETLADFGADENTLALTVLLIGKPAESWIQPTGLQTFQAWLQDSDTARYLGVNRHQGILWYDKTALKALVRWTRRLALLEAPEETGMETSAVGTTPAAALDEILAAADIAGYQVEPLLRLLRTPAEPPAKA